MKPERWRQITDVFHAARERTEADRGSFLDGACAGDPALRAEVEGMLVADRDAGSFGETPIVVPEEERPRLEPGTPVGPYRIEALIGSGGMGEVYRARDARLDRSVAVKVLPRRIAIDPGYRQRLEREAKALAALSHPHICPVFDIGQQDGVDYLVMEYVEGETLAKRLTRGALPPKQALNCAVEIADALDKAHAHGIVHRDLKPGNIMLTKAGARLLDFGLATHRLARPLPPADGAAPTEPLAEHSGVMGTLQYMAPEQLAGKRADPRSDIFAFGAVVYEMVTGRKAFEGESPSKVIEAILEHEPEAVSTLSPASPPALAHLIRACLAKDPDRRWQSAGDMGRYLAWLVADGSNARSGASVSAGVESRLRNRPLLWLAAAGLGLLSAFVGVRWLARDRAAPPLVQTSLPGPPGVLLQLRVGFALSPDGRQLAFSARDRDGLARLWLRPLDGREARPLAGTEGALAPFWSPDGRDIGFFADQQLKRIPAAGGVVQVLAAGAMEPKGGTWSADGRIVYAPDYRVGLFEIPAQGGKARQLTTLDAGAGELSHRWPWFLPDGRSLLFLVQTAEAGAKDDRSRVEVLEPGGGRHEILRGNTSAAYAAPGHLLFWRTGSLFAQPFDPERGRLGGEAKQIAPGLDLTWNEWAAFTVTDTGTLAYASALPWRLEWRERAGRVQQVAAPEGEYANPALSPDGGRLAYVAGNTAVRILDLVRGTDTRLTPEGADHDAPAWAPDGEWVAYFANRPKGAGGEIWRRRSSVLGEPEMLYSSPSVVRNLSWSPDGRWIAFEASDDILLLDLLSRTAKARIATPAFEAEPNFSPDGRWLAYSSMESGRLEVYVVPTFDGPGKWQVSSGGGFTPRWAPGGRALFFHGADHNLKIVAMELGKEPRFGLGESVFELPGGEPWRPVYDIGPDGRILATVQRSQTDSDGFKLILNWPRLLEPAR